MKGEMDARESKRNLDTASGAVFTASRRPVSERRKIRNEKYSKNLEMR